MIISSPVAVMYKYPDALSEHTDDVLYGTECEVLDKLLGFCRIKTSYGYTGYVMESDLATQLAKPNRIIISTYADISYDNTFHKAPILSLPMGSLVDVGFSHEEEYKDFGLVVLPDKRMFWIKKSNLGEIPENKTEAEARKIIISAAKRFLGTQYRWGGRTYCGIDCSGLAFTCYSMAGITIWRDADIEKSPNMQRITKAEAKEGDLFFFPGHVAIYLGNNKIIHSTSSMGGVCIQSLEKGDADYNEWCANNISAVGTVF